MLKVNNMATLRNFVTVSEKYNAAVICTIGNYAQKWVTGSV